MLPIQIAVGSILLTKGPNPQLNFDVGFVNNNGLSIDYGTRAYKKNDVFNVEIWTPLKEFRNISMHGTLKAHSSSPKDYILEGYLYRNLGTYKLQGLIKMAKNYPADVKIRVIPSTGRDGIIELSITEPRPQSLDFQFSAIEDGKMCQMSGGFSKSEKTGLDFSVLVESSEPEIARIRLNGKLQPQKEEGHVIGELGLETPWKQLGIEKVNLQSDVYVRSDGGRISGEFSIGEVLAKGSCIWDWIFAEKMSLVLESFMERPKVGKRIVHASAKYLNPGRTYEKFYTGGKLNVDSKWTLSLNSTFNYHSSDNIQFGLITELPAPVGDVHHINARYRGNIISKFGDKNPNLFLETKYSSDKAQHKFLSRVSYRNLTDLQGLGHIEWGKAKDISVVEGDFQMLRKKDVRREFYAKLITPKYKNENTFFLTGNYDMDDKYHNVM